MVDIDTEVTVTGQVTSVKPKSDPRRGRYFGVVVVEKKDDQEQAFWFAWEEESSCPEKGDTVSVHGRISGVSNDGKMVFVDDADIGDLDHKCDHAALIRKSQGRYECSDCGTKMKVV